MQNCANLMFCRIYCARAFKQLNTCTASCEIVAFTTYSVSLYSLTSPLTLFGPGLDRVKARYILQCKMLRWSIAYNWSWNASRHLKQIWDLLQIYIRKERVLKLVYKYFPYFIMLRPISTQLDAWSTLVGKIIWKSFMVEKIIIIIIVEKIMIIKWCSWSFWCRERRTRHLKM